MTYTSKEKEQGKVNTYLPLAVISTVIGICSCFGFVGGLAAVFISINANKRLKEGDYEKAAIAAKQSKYIAIAVIVITIAVVIYQFVFGGFAEVFMESFREGYEDGYKNAVEQSNFE